MEGKESISEEWNRVAMMCRECTGGSSTDVRRIRLVGVWSLLWSRLVHAAVGRSDRQCGERDGQERSGEQ